jgi:hypothetical protein
MAGRQRLGVEERRKDRHQRHPPANAKEAGQQAD